MTGKLNAVERGLLATRVAKLRGTLDPALTNQNWHSLGILDFVAIVNKVQPFSKTSGCTTPGGVTPCTRLHPAGYEGK